MPIFQYTDYSYIEYGAEMVILEVEASSILEADALFQYYFDKPVTKLPFVGCHKVGSWTFWPHWDLLPWESWDGVETYVVGKPTPGYNLEGYYWDKNSFSYCSIPSS